MSQNKQWRAVNTSELLRKPLLKTMYSAVQPFVERWLGFAKLTEIHDDIMMIMQREKWTGSYGFVRGCMQRLRVTCEFEDDLVEAIQQIEGPVVVVANHPYGCIDAMSLMHLMQQARPSEKGWAIMANKVLHSIEALRAATFAVDPFAKESEKGSNLRVMKDMMRYLRGGGMLAMFPAGRVSAWSGELNAVRDLPWSDHALKLAKAAKAHILVVHISGQNSDDFLSIPTENITRRAMMLAREIPKQEGKKVKLSYGGIISPAEVERLAKKKRVNLLRARCYAATERSQAETVGGVTSSSPEDLVMQSTSESHELLAEVEKLRQSDMLWENEKVSLFMFRGDRAPHLLNEVGKGRAVTFAAIGAGAGNEIDLSPEDQYYHHLVLWNHESKSLIGAYRVGFVNEVVKDHGVKGLYLDHVFEIDPNFYNHLGAAMELSRSFILPEYQKNPQMLDFLWRGLGLVSQKTGCKTFFGSVTISASFSPLSQAILVETLDQYHSDDKEVRDLIQARVPFEPQTAYHPMIAEAWREDGLNRLNGYIEELEGGHRSIPPLVRYYAALGAKFLCFHVEPSFNNAIYCLLSVRLKDMPKRYRKRFLGEG